MGSLEGKRILSPAIFAFSRDKEGSINNAQVIRITDDGQKHMDVTIRKQTYGPGNGRAVNLNNMADDSITYLVEGVETGLSIVQANEKAQVLAVLGNTLFAKIDC